MPATNAATQIYREAQGWVQVPPSPSDAEEQAALTQWLLTSPEHLRAYERALVEHGKNSRARSDVPVDIESVVRRHSDIVEPEFRRAGQRLFIVGIVTLAVDILFLFFNQTMPSTPTELMMFLCMKLPPLILVTVAAYLFAARPYFKLRQALNANMGVRAGLEIRDVGTINSAIANVLETERNIVMEEGRTTEALEAMRVPVTPRVATSVTAVAHTSSPSGNAFRP